MTFIQPGEFVWTITAHHELIFKIEYLQIHSSTISADDVKYQLISSSGSGVYWSKPASEVFIARDALIAHLVSRIPDAN